MGLETLLASYQRYVTNVTHVHTSNRKAYDCYVSKRADVTAVTADLSLSASHRTWWIRGGDGSLITATYCPPATEEEVRRLYPKALAIEVEEGNES